MFPTLQNCLCDYVSYNIDSALPSGKTFHFLSYFNYGFKVYLAFLCAFVVEVITAAVIATSRIVAVAAE
jgi:hypothetical protein